MEKTIKQLQSENDELMRKLKAYTTKKDQMEFYDLIGKLIENELNQEKLCNG